MIKYLKIGKSQRNRKNSIITPNSGCFYHIFESELPISERENWHFLMGRQGFFTLDGFFLY
jgi:hypothetical protein